MVYVNITYKISTFGTYGALFGKMSILIYLHLTDTRVFGHLLLLICSNVQTLREIPPYNGMWIIFLQ